MLIVLFMTSFPNWEKRISDVAAFGRIHTTGEESARAALKINLTLGFIS